MKRACVSGSEWWFIRYCGLHPPLSLPPLLPKHTRSHPRAGINLEERLTGLAAVVVVALPLLIVGVRLAEDCMRPGQAKPNAIRVSGPPYHISLAVPSLTVWPCNLPPTELNIVCCYWVYAQKENGSAPSAALIRRAPRLARVTTSLHELAPG